ncbi:MAG: enoyl-CoA hydratase/isomerase family protein, partial [Phycisphaerales bacterium]
RTLFRSVMLEALAAATDVVARVASVHAVILAGAGGVFCAGFDLSLCIEDEQAMGVLLTRLSVCVRKLRRLPTPVVGAASGAAIAGGCALLGACDFVVTDINAKIGYPVVRLGVSPAVASPLLQLAAGRAHARERLLDPGLITGEEAVRIGLATECVQTRAEVLSRAREIANALAAKPAHAVRITKSWLNELDGSDGDALLDGALAASLSTANTPEARAQLAAVWGSR